MRACALAIAAVLSAGALVGLSACGDSGNDETISEQDLHDAVRSARQKEQLKALKEKVDDLQDEGATAAAPAADNLRSEPADSSSSGGVAFISYTDSAGGWTAEIPTGGGWSAPTPSQPNPGLYETQLTGPDGQFLVVDSTPNEAPAFSGAPIDSRSTVSHPTFGTVEKIVFQGNSNFPLCETGLCVDYLVPSGSGGYGILAGGSGLADAEALAEHVLSTLQPG